MEFKLGFKRKNSILALGAESSGSYSCYSNGTLFLSQDFGDLLEEKNWQNYQKAVLDHLKKNTIQPKIILTDLHPQYKTTIWGEELCKKYKAKHIQIQHHTAHIFSAVGNKLMNDPSYQLPDTFYGIAMDGTGYGEDKRIWGGEVFEISNKKITRIGHLENQILIGGDLAVREPARMLISILDKITPPSPSGRGWSALGGPGEGKGNAQGKDYIYSLVKRYYTKNEFELIHNQLRQNFNCLETSSTGRILDAVSILLGFSGNERKYKHEPIALLEANSGKPYADLKPKIARSQSEQVLDTTFLFEYLIKNLHGDKKKLAATAQLYIAQGLYKIIKNSCHPERSRSLPATRQGSARKYCQRYFPEDSSTTSKSVTGRCEYTQNDIFFSGGIANNKIISKYLVSNGAYAGNTIPCGDAGLSFGQIIYYLLSK